MKNLIFTICAFAAVAASANGGGTTIGSGGDALRELFNNARGVAALKVEQLNTCSFDNSTSQGTQAWLIKNQTQLALDIRLSQHAWVVDSQSTCGFTNHSPQSTVYLSYPTCAATGNDLNAALFILIHESAHHLGVDDERQADEVARAVMYSRYVANCSSGGGVLDPNICSSAPMTTADAQKYFKPGDIVANVGNYKFYGQITRCVPLTGCEPPKPWSFSSILFLESYQIKNLALRLSATGQSPYFFPSFVISYGNNSNLSEFEFPMSDTGKFLVFSALYDVWFSGPTYRDPSNKFTLRTRQNNNGPDFRFRRDCLWAKWSNVYPMEGGATEKVEVVLYGTH